MDVQCIGVRLPTQLTVDDRARARDLVDVDDVVAAAHAEVLGLPRPLGERLQDRAGQPHEVEPAHRRARRDGPARTRSGTARSPGRAPAARARRAPRPAGRPSPCGRRAAARARSRRARRRPRPARARSAPGSRTAAIPLTRRAPSNPRSGNRCIVVPAASRSRITVARSASRRCRTRAVRPDCAAGGRWKNRSATGGTPSRRTPTRSSSSAAAATAWRPPTTWPRTTASPTSASSRRAGSPAATSPATRP